MLMMLITTILVKGGSQSELNIIIIILARTPEIGQGQRRILSCGARTDLDGPMIIVDSEPPPFIMTY